MNSSRDDCRKRTARGRQCFFVCALLVFHADLSPARDDSWQQRAPVPGARAAHSAVWTGREMIVWGGGVDGSFLDTGARYVPSTDTWHTTSPYGAPSPRWYHAAVWTGSEMIIWGGRPNFDVNGNFNDGARYNPVTDTWSPISGYSAPTGRSQFSAVWTGEEMIVWGGGTEGGMPLADGAAYNPVTDEWRPIGLSGLAPRMEPTAVWTGNEMIVFGGVDTTQSGWLSFGDGARYNPFTDSWTPLPAGAPGSRTGHTAVWTGERMIVWGGRELPADSRLNDGAIYNPGSDNWTGISPYDAPQTRALHAAVWTGTEMIVWGGDNSGNLLNTGARYNPATGIWTPTTQNNAPGKRMFQRPDLGIWTGRGMLVCAGSDYPASLDSTALYTVFDPPCPPVIREQPQDVSVIVGSPVTLTVGAGDCATAAHPSATQTSSGPYPQSFEFETGARVGQLQFDYEFFSIPDSLRVYYDGERIFDSDLSGQGTIRVAFGPGSAQSVNIVVNEDGGPASTAWEYTVSFRPPPLHYQWRKDGAALADETNATLHFQSVNLGDAGDYSVVAANNSSAVISDIATLTVQPSPPTNCVAAPSGLVSWWPAEGNANDRIGSNQGTLLRGVTYASGKVGSGFLFPTGGVGAVKFAASPSLDVGAGDGFTVEGWIRLARPDPEQPIAEWNDGTRWGSHFWVHDAVLYANLTGPGGEWHTIFSSAGVPAGSFHHVALTYDKATGRVRMYLDSAVVADQEIGSFTPETAFDFYLGRRPLADDGASFNGVLDEFSLYNRALSAGEIGAIHLAGVAGKCSLPPSGQAYDVSRDFSSTHNPHGAWSYGYQSTLGGTFTLLTFPLTSFGNNPVPVDSWSRNGYEPVAVYHNGTTDTSISDDGAGVFPPGTTWFYPGVEGNIDNYGVIRFTVPADGAGTYQLETAVRAYLDGPRSGDTDFHVLWNGVELFGEFVADNSGTSFSNRLSLAAGDRIDFGVGRGQDGIAHDSGLKIQATLTLITNMPPQGDLVFNGSFEMATVAPGTIDGLNSTAIIGWTVQDIDYMGDPWVAGDGLRSLDMNGWIPGTISQEVSGFVVGHTYRLAFLMAGNPYLIPPLSAIKRLRATIGTTSHEYSFDATGHSDSDLGWISQTLDFTATSPVMGLNFVSLTEGPGGAALDKISITLLTNAPPLPTNCIAAPSGLVAWWRGDGDATDRAGTNRGVLFGGTRFATGVVGRAFSFTTPSNGVKIAASPELDVGVGAGMTIELWINPDDVTQRGPLVEWNNGSDLFGAHFWILPNQSGAGLQPPSPAVAGPGQLYAAFTLLGQWYQMVTDADVLTPHVFQHVALTYDKTTGVGRIYRNGAQVAEQTLGVFTPQTSYDLYLGLRPAGPPGDPSEAFHGLLDEVSIFNRALSRSEIQSVFQAGAAGKCSGTNLSQPAVVFDVSKDFSPTSNPTGAWSYGYSATLGGQFNLLTFAKSYGANNGVPISGWQVTDALSPAVNRVMGNGIAISEGGAFTAPSGTVYVWPGNDGSPGVFGLIRFTVPASGSGIYRIESAARPTFDGPVSGDSDFHVLKNGQELFGQFLSPSSAAGYSNTLALVMGDAIDFAVGRGADGSPDHSSLKVHVILRSIAQAAMSVDSVSFAAAGSFRVTGHASPGMTCRVERSTDLVAWEAAGSAVAAASGVLEFIDSRPPAGPACFYRLSNFEP